MARTIKRMAQRPGIRGHDRHEMIVPLDVKSAQEMADMLSREVHCYGYLRHGARNKTMCGIGVVSGSVFGHAMFLRMKRAGLNTCARCLKYIEREVGIEQ